MDNGGAFTARLLYDAGVRPGMRVLDVGCGPGDVSLRLASIVGPDGRVVGLDRDDSALSAARERGRERGLDNVDFVLGDLDGGLPDGGAFDVVVGRRVLMYLPDIGRALSSLRLVMKPRGLIVFQEHDSVRLAEDPLPPAHARLHDLLWRTIAREGGNVHTGLALAPALHAAGFRIMGTITEVTMLLPELTNQLGLIGAHMVPRMVAAGVVNADDLQPELLQRQLDEERAALPVPTSWETIFGVWAHVL